LLKDELAIGLVGGVFRRKEIESSLVFLIGGRVMAVKLVELSQSQVELGIVGRENQGGLEVLEREIGLVEKHAELDLSQIEIKVEGIKEQGSLIGAKGGLAI